MPEIRYAKNFRTNVAFGWLHALLRLGIGIFLVAYVIRSLEPEQWGLVVLANGIVGLLALMQLSGASGIAKRLNTYLSQDREVRFRYYFVASVATCVLIAMAIAIVALGIATLAWSHFSIPRELTDQARHVLLITAGGTVCIVLALPYTACVQALHRTDIHSKLNMFGLCLRPVLIVVVFEVVAPSATFYVATRLLVSVIVLVGQYLWVRQALPIARINVRLLNLKTIGSVVGFNLLTMFNAINHTLFTQMPAILLQWLGSLQSVGLYGMGIQFHLILNSFVMVPSRSFSPVVVSLIARRELERTRRLFATMCKSYFVLAILCAIGTAFWGPAFFRGWIGERSRELIPALPWLGLTVAAGVAALPSAETLIAFERLRVPGLIGLCLVLVAAIVLWLRMPETTSDRMIHVYRTLAMTNGAYQVARIAMALRCLRYRLKEILMRWLLPIIGLGLILVMLAAATCDPGLTISDITYWLWLGPFLLVTGIFSWIFVYDFQDRRIIVQHVGRVFRQRRRAC